MDEFSPRSRGGLPKGKADSKPLRIAMKTDQDAAAG
jgi:hypothetical protein